MTNYEFYKEEIEMRYRNGESFALTKQGCVVNCSSIDCSACMFSTSCNPDTYTLLCGDRKMMWAVQEHVEKPKLTKQERKFCELLEGKNCWFARDLDGSLTLFVFKPEKDVMDGAWWVDDFGAGAAIMTEDELPVFEIVMPFIKWKDEEPWSVEELLKLEVEE